MSFKLQFANISITDVNVFAESINGAWTLTRLLYQNGAIGNAIRETKDIHLIEKFELLQKFKDADIAIFILQYIIKPQLPFRFKGFQTDELQKIGAEMVSRFPYIDPIFEDMLAKRVFSVYLKVKQLDEESPKLYESILDLEKNYLIDKLNAYYKLGYLFSTDKGYRYAGQTFSDQRAFFNFLFQKEKLVDFSRHKEFEPYLIAWLEVQGYKESVNVWRERLAELESWR